jgi:hypothetical protein
MNKKERERGKEERREKKREGGKERREGEFKYRNLNEYIWGRGEKF